MKYRVVTLSGPSGSGKTTIMDMLIAMHPEIFQKIKSMASKTDRLEDYISVSIDTFKEMIKNDEFIEHTLYCGNYYGLPKNFLDNIDEGKIGIKAFDIYGVEALKKIYGDKVFSVFLHRKTENLIKEINKRNVSDEEKNTRISSLENEQKNCTSPLFDLVIEVEEGNVDAAIAQILNNI